MNGIAQKARMSNFINSIDEAIRKVGGDTSEVDNICDYPSIIKRQLLGDMFQMRDGQGTTVDKDGVIFRINANSDAILLKDVIFENVTIPKGTTVQKSFEILFEDILPNLPCLTNEEIDEMFT